MSFSLPMHLAPIKRLMTYVMTGDTINDDKWKEKAIKSLVKKLRKTNQLDVLEHAVACKDPSTSCVTIPRSLDGRLQVGPKKGWPHVFYCQLFRWPDLHSQHELRHIPTCEFAFHRKYSEVCVNPYHYVRVENPSILVPSYIPMTSSTTSTATESSGSSNKSSLDEYPHYNLTKYGRNITNHSALPPRPQLSPITNSPTSNAAISQSVSSPSSFSSSDITLASGTVTSSSLVGENVPSIDSPRANNATTAISAITNSIIIEPTSRADTLANNTYVLHESDPFVIKMDVASPLSQSSGEIKVDDSSESEMDMGRMTTGSYDSKRQLSEDTVTLEMDQESLCNNQFQVGLPDSQIFDGQMSPTPSGIPTNQNHFANSLFLHERFYQRPGSSGTSEGSRAPLLTPVDYHVLEDWCSVHYYEYNTRVGDTFRCSSSRLIVDGYTNPNTSDRFCLGMLSNVKRELEAEITRRHIGKGITLFFLAGEVTVECDGDSAIFVQSPNCNYMNDWHVATVVKVPPGCNLKIFDNALFAKLLKEYVNHSYEAVFELNKMCILRISFVKGWGSSYKRQNITSTPCWIEIHLHGPLQWLDRILRQMGSSVRHCSSMS